MHEELIDRFGLLPETVNALLDSHRLRVAATISGHRQDRCAFRGGDPAILEPQPPIDAMRIIDLVQKNKHIKLNGQDKLRITANMPDLAARVAQIKSTFSSASK